MCDGGLSVPALRQFSRRHGGVRGDGLGDGALETVLALGSSPAVVSLQLIRLICVILFAGWLPRILARR